MVRKGQYSLTEEVGVARHLRDVDATRANRKSDDMAVAKLEFDTCEDAGNHVARAIIACADATAIERCAGTDYTVATNCLKDENKT